MQNLIPRSANISYFSVQEGLVWAVRYGGNPRLGSIWGRFRLQFLTTPEGFFFMEIPSASPYFENVIKVRERACERACDGVSCETSVAPCGCRALTTRTKALRLKTSCV